MHRKSSRFIYMALVGIVISYILETVTQEKGESGLFGFLISIIITIIVWEGNLRIDHWLNLKFLWEKAPGKRISIQLPVSLIFTAIVIYFSMLLFNKYVCEFPVEAKEKFLWVSITVGILVSIIILSIEIGSQFFRNWKRSLVEVEKYKTESLQAQLQNLKDQINPHFMFNNLSVLSSLVYKDQDKAVDFINQLSKVYRYVLDSRNSELVSLKEELVFIESYLYLLKIRFDNGLLLQIDIAEDVKQLLLPPMALQMLVENAIKHNEVSIEFPLTLTIKTKGNKLIVSNNIQLRKNPETSCKTGLRNIKERYKYFSEELVEVEETETTFLVRLPLLEVR